MMMVKHGIIIKRNEWIDDFPQFWFIELPE